MVLSKNEVLNLTSYYLKEYDLDEAKHFNNMKEIFNMHGNKPCYVFRYISFVKNFLILSKAGMFTIEVPSKKEHIFLKKLQDACFIKVKKRRTDKTILNSEFADESYFTIDIFLLISLFNLLLISLSASNDGLKP